MINASLGAHYSRQFVSQSSQLFWQTLLGLPIQDVTASPNKLKPSSFKRLLATPSKKASPEPARTYSTWTWAKTNST